MSNFDFDFFKEDDDDFDRSFRRTQRGIMAVILAFQAAVVIAVLTIVVLVLMHFGIL